MVEQKSTTTRQYMEGNLLGQHRPPRPRAEQALLSAHSGGGVGAAVVGVGATGRASQVVGPQTGLAVGTSGTGRARAPPSAQPTPSAHPSAAAPGRIQTTEGKRKRGSSSSCYCSTVCVMCLDRTGGKARSWTAVVILRRSLTRYSTRKPHASSDPNNTATSSLRGGCDGRKVSRTKLKTIHRKNGEAERWQRRKQKSKLQDPSWRELKNSKDEK